MAEPTDIARVKASATRASVTPRLRNSAPERASVIIAASTMGGGGSCSGPASSAAIHQVARNTMKDKRRSTSVSGDCVEERAGLELWRRPDQFAAADPCQHTIEHARVGLLVGDQAARDSFPVTIAIDAQRRGIGGARQWRDLFPLRIRGRQNL